MSDHLSPDRFAKSFVEGPTSLDLQHITECTECRAGLERFGRTVSSFRSSIRERVDAQVASDGASDASEFTPLSTGPEVIANPKWRWVWTAAAVVVFVLVSVLTRETRPLEVIGKTSIKTDPDTLMNAINLHLSRAVPAPMEPMLAIIPGPEATESGGVR